MDVAVAGGVPMSILPSSFAKVATYSSSPVLGETVALHTILNILSCDDTVTIITKV